MKTSERRIIQEEILNELFDTWDEKSFNWLKSYVAANKKHNLYRKLSQYKKDNPNAGAYTGDTNMDMYNSATERNMKNRTKYSPEVNYSRKLARYSVPREKEKWMNPVIKDEFVHKYDLGDMENFDNDAKLKKFYNDKHELVDYNPNNTNKYLYLQNKLGSFGSNIKSVFSKNERKKREEYQKQLNDLQDKVYLGDTSRTTSDKFSDPLSKAMLKVRRKFRGDNKAMGYYRTKAQKILSGEMQPTESQQRILRTKRFFQGKDKEEQYINWSLYNIINGK